MRWMLLLLWVSSLGWPDHAAHAGDRLQAHAQQPGLRAVSVVNAGSLVTIDQVLERSQQARLDSLSTAERGTPAAVVIRLSHQRLVRALGLVQPIELRIISGDTVAETVHGNIVVANEALAALPEGERLFILAHELGHVASGHWSQLGNLFQKYVPGVVTQAQTDAVSEALSRDASGLARQHEFEADAFALRMLRDLGYADAHAMGALSRFGFQRGTATHPGTRQRIAALCAIEGFEAETAGLGRAP